MSATVASPPVRPADRRPGSVTAEDYLRFEENSVEKHEWFDGEVRQMPGVSAEHAVISQRIAELLGSIYAGRGFLCFSPDIKVRIPEGPYCYADGSIAELPARFESPIRSGGKRTVLLNPAVIVEVLSDSTAATDRGEKLDGYRTIPSLTDYLLFSQDGPEVEHHRREPGGEWERIALSGPEAVATLSAAGATFKLGDVYSVLDGLAG